jgi:hypothetical protein
MNRRPEGVRRRIETNMEQTGCTIKLSEQDELIILVGADRINLGPIATACSEMCRFMTEVDYGRCATEL